ncbi:DUF1631 family protein, partial [Herbaspirillum sp. HC18]
AVANALRAACEEVDPGVQMRLVLLQSLEQHISGELSRLYHELNGRLVRQNVLPGLRRGFRRSPAAAVRPRDASVAPVGMEQRGLPQPDFGTVSAIQGFGTGSVHQGFGEASQVGFDGDGDVYAMLAQLVQGQLAA